MPPNLSQHPIHLGLGATASSEPEFTGMDFYAPYAERHAADGREGRLVTTHTFSESWDVWEMHPNGSEVVLCTEGQMTVVQEMDGQQLQTTLSAGQYVINEPGVWHTANVKERATALFITAGLGTEHRPR
jgi:uncharacterized cupin superfamily protein